MHWAGYQMLVTHSFMPPPKGPAPVISPRFSDDETEAPDAEKLDQDRVASWDWIGILCF